MELSKVVLGVDLDGVCADFYGKMREICAEWLEKPLDALPLEVSYGLPEWGLNPADKGQYQSLHRFAVTQRDLFRTCGMIPGARKYLTQLSDQKVRIRIITNRLFIHHFHNDAVSQTVDWLDNNGIPYWDLCFMREKEQVGATLYVDDTPSNIRQLRERKLHTICFANSTNKDVEAPRAKNWKEVYEMVLTYAAEY